MKISRTDLNRVSRLEAAQPVERKPPSPWPMIFHKLIAFHLGKWDRQTDSAAEAYARATGWTTPENRNMQAMQAAMMRDDPLYDERYQAALRRMFAERGVELGREDDREVLGALIAEARAGGMSLPELDEMVGRAA
jgi:hypothetical protein